jgi:anti-anti-sigma factor
MATTTHASSFNLRRASENDVQVVLVSGCMGNNDCHRVEEELRHLLEQKHRRAVLDCGQLAFITSPSLARLFVCAQEFRRHGGQIRLAGLSSVASRMAQLVGFNKKTELQLDVATALKSFSGEAARSPRSGSRNK